MAVPPWREHKEKKWVAKTEWKWWRNTKGNYFVIDEDDDSINKLYDTERGRKGGQMLNY